MICVPHRRGDGPSLDQCFPVKLGCSPQAWGWPARPSLEQNQRGVFPTGVGMARNPALRPRSATGVPHRRGDGPFRSGPLTCNALCSPQAWGWPGGAVMDLGWWVVFPTGVGMARSRFLICNSSMCVPHRRGDGPPFNHLPILLNKCSPQAWGWPGFMGAVNNVSVVFPTGVGMARFLGPCRAGPLRVPHRRGDGPNASCPGFFSYWCSPQAWGWPDSSHALREHFPVFPTGVGMARVCISVPDC